jgi:hypothetical protein
MKRSYAGHFDSSSDLAARKGATADMTRRKIFIALFLALCTTACGPKKAPVPPPLLTVYIQPDRSANNGRVFWMVVKEVDEDQFASDTYDKIEAAFLADERDPDVLGVCSVTPGQKRRITVSRPIYRSAGFYFLFTEPGDNWKVLLRHPIGTKHDLIIGKNKASVTKRMSSW